MKGAELRMNHITMNLVADDIIRFALREDMNAGDLSTESVCPAPREARVQLIAKGEGVIAGLDVFARTFALLDPATTFDALVSEGDEVAPGQLLGTVRGDARVLLSGERVALNFLQRMSGIATYTRRTARALDLREDMNAGDLSTESVCPAPREARVQLIAKGEGVIAGLDVFARTFALLDPATTFDALVSEGDEVAPGQLLGTVRGDARVLLSGERVALNFLQRMSGIATYTRRTARALEGTSTVLVDTRKTTPCLRIFEKAAVEVGGGRNHRYNLSQAVMLKDNQIDAAGGIAAAVAGARRHAPFVCTVEAGATIATTSRRPSCSRTTRSTPPAVSPPPSPVPAGTPRSSVP